MKKTFAGLLLSAFASASLAQTEITFDVIFHTVHEASGAFAPTLRPTAPGPFNSFMPVPDVELTGRVTLTLVDNGTQLAPPPAVNTIALDGMFSTESGNAPSNSWSIHSLSNVLIDIYADNSFVALDSTSDPRDWPLLTGTAVDGLLSDHGPAGQYPGGICPFDNGCLSANPFQLFPNGTEIFDVDANGGVGAAVWPTYADAGHHPLIAGQVTQTLLQSGIGFENGTDVLAIEAVLDNLNNLQPYGDGVDGNPGIVRLVIFSQSGSTAYMIEGSIVEVPVPVPAAVWLFGSGLGLLAWFRRRSTCPGARRPGRRGARLSVLLVAALLLAGCFGGGDGAPMTDPDNRTPVANAGPDQTELNQITVMLDGSASSDADGDELTFSWAFASRPSGSNATLTGADTETPEFTPDVVGDYVVRLTVDDGFASGTNSDTVTVTAEDPGTQPPVADAGPDQDVSYTPPGITVNLDGTGSSDPDMDPLSFSWQIVEFTPASGVPPQQPVVLFGADTATPFFDVDAPDQLGVYRIELTVSDGTLQDTDEVLITVTKGMPAASLLFGSGLFGAAAFTWRYRRRDKYRDRAAGESQ